MGIVTVIFASDCVIMSLARFIPLFDRVLVQRAVAAATTKGGIHIPESAQKKEAIAKVVAVGEGLRTESGAVIKPSVAVGDEVYLPEFGGTKLKLGSEDYFLYRDSDFLAKLAPESSQSCCLD